MQFVTKKDIIKRYISKRKIFTDEKEVEDILNSFLDYTLKKLKSPIFTHTYAYELGVLGFINEKSFNIKDLIEDPSTDKFKKAENMMHEDMLQFNGKKIKSYKKYDLKNDKLRRI
jgi:hypothetical protein